MLPNSVLNIESFKVVKRIGAGGYGIVDQGIGPNGQLVALKKERASKHVTRSMLAYEYQVYQALAGHPCVPAVKAFGRQGNFNVLAMDLLGPTLGDQFWKRGGKFTIGMTASLGLGMLDAIEYIHSRGFIHRDLTPENFLFGRSGDRIHIIHAIDFGFARQYRDPQTGSHLPFSDDRIELIGTIAYASLGAHLGQARSRGDDLESFVYILLHFARGSLPWDKIQGGTERHRAIRAREKKVSWTATRLCEGLPPEMKCLAEYCLSLGWSDDPQYEFLRAQLQKLSRDHPKELLQVWNPNSDENIKQLERRSRTPLGTQAEFEPPPVRRGDVVLLKLLPLQSLDYATPPRVPDPSYYPHENLHTPEWLFPFRPALVRKVSPGVETFRIDIYPLMRRKDGISQVAIERRCLFKVVPPSSSKVLTSEMVYAYRTNIQRQFYIQYDRSQSFKTGWSLDEATVKDLEDALEAAPCSYSRVYDTDDDETRAIRGSLPDTWYGGAFVAEMVELHPDELSNESDDMINWTSCNGWMPEMIAIDAKRMEEDGELSEDDESDSDMSCFDGPRPRNRRKSCTFAAKSTK